jgi:hypothetical protein
MNRLPIARAMYAAVVLAAVSLVFAIFLRDPGINGFQRAMYGDMIHGTADRPFVYRALLPAATRALVALVPDGAKAALVETARTPSRLRAVFAAMKWESELAPEYLCGVTLMYACFWGFFFAMRFLARATCGPDRLLEDTASLAAILGLPPFFTYYSYIYDPPALLLFTLGLALMARASWAAYLAVFTLGAINKETIVLLGMVFAIHFRTRMPPRAWIGLLAAQAAIAIAVRTALQAAYAQNPGMNVEWHLFHNLQLLKAYPIGSFAGWLAIAALVAHGWHAKPAFLRDALWVLPALLVLTFLFGLHDELRDYYEAFPVVAVLAAHSLARMIRPSGGGPT